MAFDNFHPLVKEVFAERENEMNQDQNVGTNATAIRIESDQPMESKVVTIKDKAGNLIAVMAVGHYQTVIELGIDQMENYIIGEDK